jgi:hypothetical protein
MNVRERSAYDTGKKHGYNQAMQDIFVEIDKLTKDKRGHNPTYKICRSCYKELKQKFKVK